MGYVNQAPIKQVWLPFDYVWLVDHTDGGSTFKTFAEAYKEKYGIDLHDIFSLNIKADRYTVNSKVDLVGAYTVGKMNGNLNTKYALHQAIHEMLDVQQIEGTSNPFVFISVGDFANYAQGFQISVPPQGEEVNSIDDCVVTIYEL